MGQERDLLALVDELVDTATVSDPLWLRLSAVWTPEQLVELVALVGYYHFISFTTNAFRIPLEPFAMRFLHNRAPGALLHSSRMLEIESECKA